SRSATLLLLPPGTRLPVGHSSPSAPKGSSFRDLLGKWAYLLRATLPKAAVPFVVEHSIRTLCLCTFPCPAVGWRLVCSSQAAGRSSLILLTSTWTISPRFRSHRSPAS